MEERFHDNLITTPAPHVLGSISSARIRGAVLLALLPAVCVSVYLYGGEILARLVLCTAVCMALNIICDLVLRRSGTVGDLGTMITGITIYCLLPADAGIAETLIACGIAVILGKYVFSMSRYTRFNEAALGVFAIMLMFPESFVMWIYPDVRGTGIAATDIVGPTALARSMTGSDYSFIEIFMGFVPGPVGVVSAFALLVAGVFLVWKKVIRPEGSLAFLATVTVLGIFAPGTFWVHALGDITVFAAVFLMTEYTSSPKYPSGRIVAGIGVGIITIVCRWLLGADFPGVLLGILIMNIVTPIIDDHTTIVR